MHKISPLETKLMRKLNVADDVKNYLNHVEEEGAGLGRWPEIFQKGRVAVSETHDYMIKLYNAVKHFNSILDPFGGLICECITCYDFTQQQVNKKKNVDNAYQ
ncbi:hypothetical protein M0R45_010557 [Rubus argutus]|uniref:Uncharacterized protein n=1 Tax=Rubus argutus TaxID=59490 RepID=A0AAW1Y957_RUBAR